MRISLVLAMAEHRVIGRDGGLPWHLSDDLRRFKRLTLGHVIVMGRKTFASIGRALPQRRTVVLTRRGDLRADGIETAASLDEALARHAGEDEIFIVGGAAVYAAALPRADRIYLTRIHANLEGDVVAPAWDEAEWELVEEEHHARDERHAHAFTFQTFERRP